MKAREIFRSRRNIIKILLIMFGFSYCVPSFANKGEHASTQALSEEATYLDEDGSNPPTSIERGYTQEPGVYEGPVVKPEQGDYVPGGYAPEAYSLEPGAYEGPVEMLEQQDYTSGASSMPMPAEEEYLQDSPEAYSQDPGMYDGSAEIPYQEDYMSGASSMQMPAQDDYLYNDPAVSTQEPVDGYADGVEIPNQEKSASGEQDNVKPREVKQEVRIGTMLKDASSRKTKSGISKENASALQRNVKVFLKKYQKMLQRLADKPTALGSRLRTNNAEALADNRQSILHTIEVIDLIISGALDECCWRERPSNYYGKRSIRTSDIIAWDRFDVHLAKSSSVSHYVMRMKELKEQIEAMGFVSNANGHTDRFEQYALGLLESLQNGAFNSGYNLFANLSWQWPHLNNKHLAAAYKNYYSRACVVCFGGGFYDTAGLGRIDPATGQPFYRRIVTERSFPLSYDWLMSRAKVDHAEFELRARTEIGGSSEIPLQVSIGLSYHVQSGQSFSNEDAVQPAQCHRANELYFVVDPMHLHRDGAEEDEVAVLPNGYPSAGYVATINTQRERQTEDESADLLMNPLLSNEYKKVSHGDVLYFDSLDVHSIHPGPVAQLAAWARFTHPTENSYFLANEPLSSLDLVACNPSN